MKKIIFSLLMLSAFSVEAQQSFAGFRTSPYGGMYSIINNPAETVGGMRRGGVNLFSIDGNFSTNKVGLTLDVVKDFEKYTKIQGNPTFSSNDIDADLNLDILGPSAYFHVGEKNAFAITSRLRTIVDIRGIDAKILHSYLSDINTLNIAGYPTINIDNQHILANAFSEVGLSWGGILINKENHKLKVGVTLKYVQGIISSRAGFSDDFSGKMELGRSGDDLILDVQGTGDFTLSNGGLNVFNSDSKFKLDSQATTIAFDAGAVYEYRKEPCPDCEKTPYDFKVGVSFTDVGRLNYTVTDNSYRYRINTGSSSISLNLDDIQKALTNAGALVTEEALVGTTFTSSLPVAFRLNADARVWRSFFVDFSGQFAAADKKDKAYSAAYGNSFVITPRYEKKWFGFYVPISNVSDVGTSVGAGLRAGPLVVGSSSLISNLLSDNSKAINVFAGLQFQWK